MKYPSALYSNCIDHRPSFPDLLGEPFVADLSIGNPLLRHANVSNPGATQKMLAVTNSTNT
jgi:hypothetical protein